MSQLTTEEVALEVLLTEASKIKNLISNQQNHMCIAQCKAFEEVVDTQMYGFSRQVDFAVKIGVISYEEGQQRLLDLERELNRVYMDVYEESKQHRER
ncbi:MULTISPECIES: DUF1507 family protein [Vagococcus]|uniref:DUF1507 family protein n=1 Tax=Vagococcus TaxID=2737 RepID=UPI000EEB3AE7|nr:MULTISPECIES: DUF1507 family protein [Vagococcus]MDT2806257.1 DUF1507 family protein [Vagococcus lutrae]UQF19646.1 YlaN family protein [Vagococcus lutrae]HCT95601.1 hypothetical protein [Vagococcus sp.]